MKIILALVLGVSAIAMADVPGELPSRIPNLCAQGDCTESFAAIGKAYDALKSLKLPTFLSVYQGECEFTGPHSSLGKGANIAVVVEKIGEKYFVTYRISNLFDYDNKRKLVPSWADKTPLQIRDSVADYLGNSGNELLIGAGFGYRPFDPVSGAEHLWIRTTVDGTRAIVLGHFGWPTFACDLKNTLLD